MTKTISKADLAQFTGTEAYHYLPHHPQCVVYTDGVKYLAARAGAYWLLDLIAFYQTDERIKHDESLQGIQFWHLRVNDGQGVLTCERDKDDVVLTHELHYTDFPLNNITLYVCQKVMMLPSEY
ncbi:hypothetical protein IQ273_14680 [Nodosilinea sp. LEGE 07298]|uniref:DUF6876 family protein n=1 Tax=Nodosilinea sp. LEGE 07298 TaxID=2777970 RepID=UPI00187E7806|nr:DUF6876 family protein [Nodosilinea sp. LEGE 07298]MBE9110664.1 hypothetical protein [Nodosilinea sp. LEGE 07298]